VDGLNKDGKPIGEKNMQKTLAIIKPDAVGKGFAGDIMSMMEKQGLKIVDSKIVHLTIDQAKEFYKVHKGRHFFELNAEFMSSGPCIMMVLQGENAISEYRKLMGATDFTEAKMGTIRNLYGTSIRHNAVHGSDSEESVNFEINFFNSIK
jgi:nucleoside-diphosphate kinase